MAVAFYLLTAVALTTSADIMKDSGEAPMGCPQNLLIKKTQNAADPQISKGISRNVQQGQAPG